MDVLKEVLRNKLEFGSLQNFNLYIGVNWKFLKIEIGCGKSTSKSHYAEIKVIKTYNDQKFWIYKFF